MFDYAQHGTSASGVDCATRQATRERAHQRDVFCQLASFDCLCIRLLCAFSRMCIRRLGLPDWTRRDARLRELLHIINNTHTEKRRRRERREEKNMFQQIAHTYISRMHERAFAIAMCAYYVVTGILVLQSRSQRLLRWRRWGGVMCGVLFTRCWLWAVRAFLCA